ncbi:hypothetical protein CCACVL1_11601, partial [Corchorus capsularis]
HVFFFLDKVFACCRWYIASSLHETYSEEEFWHDFDCGKTENVNMLVIMRVALSSSPNYLFGIGKWNLKVLISVPSSL